MVSQRGTPDEDVFRGEACDEGGEWVGARRTSHALAATVTTVQRVYVYLKLRLTASHSLPIPGTKVIVLHCVGWYYPFPSFSVSLHLATIIVKTSC